MNSYSLASLHQSFIWKGSIVCGLPRMFEWKYTSISRKKQPCTYFPPKSCIPKRAKMKMNRRRRKIKLRIDLMLFKREVTKLRKDAQNLEKEKNIVLYIPFLFPWVIGLFFQILIPGIPFFQLQQQWNTYPSCHCISLPVKSLSQTFSTFSRGISRIIPVSGAQKHTLWI